ncbi:MAG TPA: ATP-binding cassette domain-containing protein, partial [Acidimicrobiales bacterium]|nr:ATP-binding cassette domain-containing protein [Acidimicrobiales bacterium]
MVDVAGLTVDFGPLRVLHAVDLQVRAGEVLAVAGENGAGKSTLIRCLAGDLVPTAGTITVDGRRLRPAPVAAARAGIAVVWQDLALCDNLDVAANVLLGRERRLGLLSSSRFHQTAERLLADLGIPLSDAGRPVGLLSGGQRQLVAVARALRDRPRLLVLDEPTAALGVAERSQVETLVERLRARGTTVLLVSHDVEQVLRLSDRVVVLRRGRVAGELDPLVAHADDVVAVLNGQAVEGSARRQLSRLQLLADRLAQADAGSSVGLILSTLVAALGAHRACLHVEHDGRLLQVASVGLGGPLARLLADLPVGPGAGPLGAALAARSVVVDRLGADDGWRAVGPVARTLTAGGVLGTVSVPVTTPRGAGAVITVLRDVPGRPSRDELELVTLYAGYVASAIEREQLLAERTARNRVLEAIREVLDHLGRPGPLADALPAALAALRSGLGASAVALLTAAQGEEPVCRAVVPPGAAGSGIAGAASWADALAGRQPAGASAVTFDVPGGCAVLVARHGADAPLDRAALLADAAHSLRLAFEREQSERAQQEVAAARRSSELQARFLSRLSHELRTPLTAIQGYATSLMAADVAWDEATEHRFLSRITAESGRMARLVDDLLDSSAIESGTMRLHPDWTDIALVIDSARACLPLDRAAAVVIDAPPDLPVVWADHDRLQQVFVNLIDNAVRHNPPGTSVRVAARTSAPGRVTVTVTDDGELLVAAGVPASPPS